MGASVRAAQICDLTRVDLIPSRRLACGSRLKTRCAWFRRESRDLRQDQTLTDTGLRWNPCKARCRQSPNSCIAPKTTHTESVKAKLCDPTRNGSECRMYASESITKASGIHCQAAEHQGVRAPVRGALGRLHHTRPKSGHLARLSIK